MNTLLHSLPGYKTYITAAIVGVLLFGSWQAWWKLPPEIYAGLFTLALVFLRAAVGRVSQAASAPSVTSSPPAPNLNLNPTPPANRNALGVPITAFGLAVGLMLLAFSAQAQSNTTPTLSLTNQIAAPNPASLPSTILDYFTSFNPAYDSTFASNRFCLWTGASSIQGAAEPLVNDVGFSYDVWRPATPAVSGGTQIAVSIEDVLRNSGVAGTVVSDNVGVGLSFIIHDVRLTGYADGGTYFAKGTTKAEYYGELGLRAFKAIGPHFYTGVGFGAQVPKNAQVFSAFLGVTF